MPRFASLLAATVCLAGLTASASAETPRKFVPLFNGKNLDGWEGDADVWHAEAGEIVGSSDDKTIARNEFLITKKHYRNFILKVKFKLRNHNSGVQFRSQVRKRRRGYRLSGRHRRQRIHRHAVGRRRPRQAPAGGPRRNRQACSRRRLERLCDHGRRPAHHDDAQRFQVVDYTEKSDQAATEIHRAASPQWPANGASNSKTSKSPSCRSGLTFATGCRTVS